MLKISTLYEYPVEKIHITRLKENDRNMRSQMGDLQELMDSISSVGILQPLVVRPMEGYFQVVCGNRRLEACKRIGWKLVPCIIKEMDDREAAIVSLVENLQREDIDPIDEANFYSQFVDRYGWGGMSSLAKEIGKSEAYVSHRLALLRLPEEIKELISTRRLKPSVAKEIAWIKNGEMQKHIAMLAVRDNLPVRKVRAKIQEMDRGADGSADIYMVSYKKLERLLRSTLINMDGIIETVEQERELRDELMEFRMAVHQLIDSTLSKEKGRKRLIKNEYI